MKIDIHPPTLVAIPLGLARSALFSCGRVPGGQDEGQRKVPIAPQRGAKLEQKGPWLGQGHALAWQAVLHWAAEARIEDDRPFPVSVDDLLRVLGRKGGDSDQRARMRHYLHQLTKARIGYRTDLHTYGGPLLLQAIRHSPTGPMVLRIPSELPALLTNEILRNDLPRKCGLGVDALALWLHDYVATHLRPPPDAVDALRMWSGSGQDLPHFRHTLRRALRRLSPAVAATEAGAPRCAAPGALVLDWRIDRHDRLHIQKAPTSVRVPRGRSGALQNSWHKMDAVKARVQRSKVVL